MVRTLSWRRASGKNKFDIANLVPNTNHQFNGSRILNRFTGYSAHRDPLRSTILARNLMNYWSTSIPSVGGVLKSYTHTTGAVAVFFQWLHRSWSWQYAIQYLYLVWSIWLYSVAQKDNLFNMIRLTSILLSMYPLPCTDFLYQGVSVDWGEYSWLFQ